MLFCHNYYNYYSNNNDNIIVRFEFSRDRKKLIEFLLLIVCWWQAWYAARRFLLNT